MKFIVVTTKVNVLIIAKVVSFNLASVSALFYFTTFIISMIESRNLRFINRTSF